METGARHITQITEVGQKWFLVKKTATSPSGHITGSNITPMFDNAHDLVKKLENDGHLEGITELSPNGESWDREDLVKKVQAKPQKINGQFGD